MAVKVSAIIGMTISLLLIGILLPIGLPTLIAYNGTYTNAAGTSIGMNSTIGTLVGTIIPIMAVIGIVMGFVAYKNSD